MRACVRVCVCLFVSHGPFVTPHSSERAKGVGGSHAEAAQERRHHTTAKEGVLHL